MDVAQIYLRIPSGGATAPERLVGWQKVALLPGQTQRVTVTVDPRATAIFAATGSAMPLTAGMYPAFLSSSSADDDAGVRASVALDRGLLDL